VADTFGHEPLDLPPLPNSKEGRIWFDNEALALMSEWDRRAFRSRMIARFMERLDPNIAVDPRRRRRLCASLAR
jgi:hypothetical protein